MRRIDRTGARTYDHEGASRWRAPTRTAPSFNGRTADSGSAYRGSNPWGATKQSKALTLPGISPKAPVVTFCRNIRFGNMPASAAIRKNVRENCRALIVRGYDEWGRRGIASGLQCTAFDRGLVLYEKAFDMKYAKRSKLPRGLRWDARSPHICFSGCSTEA